MEQSIYKYLSLFIFMIPIGVLQFSSNLIYRKENLKKILTFSSLLALIGMVLTLFANINYIFLIYPFISFFVFNILLKFIQKQTQGRPLKRPFNLFHNYENKWWWDRALVVGYIILGMVIPILILTEMIDRVIF